VFGTDALYGLIRAGIDCIEHGTGLTDELITEMAERGTALVADPDQRGETSPASPRRPASTRPTPAHMRALYAAADDVVRRAVQAGVPVYAGTDAGGGIEHGRIADEVLALHRAGMSEAAALGAAKLGCPGLARPPRAWRGRPAT